MANFRTKARAVDLLGKEQIRDEVTAISELLRNSYDAFATEGLIDVNTKNGEIIVWDDGDGMSELGIQENWLTLGTYSKKRDVSKKNKRGRVRIGEKGIGRMAISLLGDQLLLLSKSRSDSRWSLLYLHWELFRNEKVFLEEIVIPTRSFDSLSNLIDFLKNQFNSIKDELLKNISDTTKWSEDVISKLNNEILNFTISAEVLSSLQVIEKRGCGTTFYIRNIENSSWDWNIYTVHIQEENLKKRTQRLKDVIFSFQNVIDIYDKQNSIKTDKDVINSFTPRIHINGNKLEDETWFNQDDVKLYDYALKGVVFKGKFSGKAYINTYNGAEETKIKNLSLTQGIYTNLSNLSFKDCGPIKIKWFFVEGREYLSVLNQEQHKIMMDKLENMGGIFVFRDGLRILPYGEPGNDFLNMEERRSRGAAYYLFSHRRMYGYMEITKKKNPNLIDKSSREGFIENNYYNFFRAVAINLLVWWARDFLESKKDTGKRNLRVKGLQEQREKEKRRQEKIKQEQTQEKEYFLKLDNTLSEFDKNLKIKEIEIRDNISYTLSNQNNILKDILFSRIELKDKLYKLKSGMYYSVEELDKVKIKPNLRYNHDNDLMELISHNNNLVDECIKEIKVYIDESIGKLQKELEEKISPSAFNIENVNEIDYKIEQVKNWIQYTLPSMVNEFGMKKLRAADNDFIEISRMLQDTLKNSLNDILKPVMPQIKILNEKNIILSKLQEELHSLIFMFESDRILEAVKSELTEIEKGIELSQNLLLKCEEEINDSATYLNIKEFIENIKAKAVNINSFGTENEFIGLLKREVNMYRDISAIGMAAELTSHEFNALYKSIHENLSILGKALNNTKVVPYIGNIQKAFVSLERLHQRMSPLYRQARFRKKVINLYNFIMSALEYFKSDIERYKIKAIVDIPRDFVINETEAILFTPLINLLSNAIYWLLDRNDKEIHFYMSNDMSRLYVHDTGPGVNDKDVVRIFEPFFSKKTNGRGLGLFLSKDILESKGHELRIITPGEEMKTLSGACFCIVFNKESLVRGEE